ncbi:hypothetical protein CWB72_03695 [Pseudoalteromonas phenolica]|uniref:aspartyl protease family protein n=1 Tax=Pseudoalteromonas phenolica TaxID=161398 RepID=UPI00110B5944|nr:aspartyl protease family protein [Pseudoalteromonas phenolica]TMN92844.1 hypothetical protein CWB72_03695 [Pseudoalteromonas phenolica]
MKALLTILTTLVITGCANQKLEKEAIISTNVPMHLTDKGHIYVSTQLNDVERYPMILDTAANIGVIPNSLLTKLSPSQERIDQIEVQGAVGKMTLTQARLKNTQLNNIQISDLTYIVQDLDGLKTHSQLVPGILGHGFLSSYCNIYDFTNKQVTFISSQCPHSSKDKLRAVDFRIEDNFIKIHTWFNGQKVDAILDTGAPTNVVNSKLHDLLNVAILEEDKLKGLHNKGVTKHKLAKVDFQIGRHAVVNEESFLADMPVFSALGYQEQPVLLMGLTNFKQNKLVIDYHAKKIYF